MAKYPILVVAAILLRAIAGCQSPPATKQPSAGLATSPAPSESSFNPLGKIEKSLVFAPSRYPTGDWHPPGLAFEDAWFTAKDGTLLHGWYVPHPADRGRSCSSATAMAATWPCGPTSCGFCTIAWALRRWDSTTAATAAAKGRRARRACWPMPGRPTWLAQRTGIAENQIVLMGRSLGGAVAVDLAADGARGLILESTFTSMPEVGHVTMPWLPVRTLMQTQFNSLAKIGSYHGPLLQSHGTADRLIPYAMGRQLFAAANEPKQFVEIPGGDHNDPQTDAYYAALFEFLGRL